MMRDKGSVLSMALIIVFGVYLLGNMLFVINQQYVFDVGLIHDSSLNRQKLLNVGSALIAEWSDKSHDRELLEWEHCEHQSQPDYVWSEELQVFYQWASLSEQCFSGDERLRVWLKGLDNLDDRLVIDVIRYGNNWSEEEIDGIKLHNDLGNGQTLVINNSMAKKQFELAVADSALLKNKLTRVTDDYYEIVLIFENVEVGEINVIYIAQKISEVSLTGNSVELLDVVTVNDVELLNSRISGNSKVSWRLDVRGKFEVSKIHNRVVFIGLTDRLIGVHLDGRAFWKDGLLSQKIQNDKRLIPCVYKTPLNIGEWEVGCENSQKINYYFFE